MVRCGGPAIGRLAADLHDELDRCLGAGRPPSWSTWTPGRRRRARPLRPAAAAQAFHDAGGELVVAVEEPDGACRTRGGRARARGPPAPGPSGGASEAPLRTPDRPRWEHEFTFPATTRQLPTARRRVTAYAEVAGLDGPACSSSPWPSPRRSPTPSSTGRLTAPTTTSACASSATTTRSPWRSRTAAAASTPRRSACPRRLADQRARHPLHARAVRRRAVHLRSARHSRPAGEAPPVTCRRDARRDPRQVTAAA